MLFRSGGGAAAVWSPEQPQRHADMADTISHGGGDSGAQRPSQQEIFGEDGEGETAEITACFDLSGVELRGGGWRRRRRRFTGSRGRRRRGRGAPWYFCKNVLKILENYKLVLPRVFFAKSHGDRLERGDRGATGRRGASWLA